MKLLDSLRFRIATLFQRSRMSAELEAELRSTSSTGLTIWSVPALSAPRQNAARESSLAARRSSKRNATKRSVATSSKV
jgi:hypothetical protein